MAILKVARMGHPVLRGKAREIAPEGLGSPELAALIDDLIETMQEYAGVGLAAPQVHEGLRLFVMQTDPDDEATLRVVVNPRLTRLGEEGWEDWEGCLSIPDIHGRVPRNDRVRLEAQDLEGRAWAEEFEGFAARVCQHEYDHLDGLIFFDRMRDFSTLCFGEEYRRYHAPRPKAE
ncbi:MAG: peptide deformylase [Nitrospinae bacterium]|nr:peptide deformylase [Nitrospinota bacterium]